MLKNNKLKNKIKSKFKINNKAGMGAIISFILLIVLLPLMLFLFVDVPYHNQYHRKMKSVIDNCAASTITRIDEQILAEGLLRMDYNTARTYMFESLQAWFDLDPYLFKSNVQNVYIMHRQEVNATTGEAIKSMLDADPLVIEHKKYQSIPNHPDLKDATRIEFFIHTDTSTYTYHFINGEHITVSTPTVGIYVEATGHGVIFKWPMKVKKFGISEVSLDPYVL